MMYMKFFFHFLLKNEFLNINRQHVLNNYVILCLCYACNDNEGTECHPRKIKIVKDVNEYETLVLNSAREVLQANDRGK